MNSCRRGLALLRAIQKVWLDFCFSTLYTVFPRYTELNISEKKGYELVAGFDVEGLRLEVRNMLERRPQSVAFHPLLQKVVSRKFGFCKCVNL